MVFFLFATWWYRGSGYPVVFFWIPAKNCGNDREWGAGMTEQGEDGRKNGGRTAGKMGAKRQEKWGQNGKKNGGKTAGKMGTKRREKWGQDKEGAGALFAEPFLPFSLLRSNTCFNGSPSPQGCGLISPVDPYRSSRYLQSRPSVMNVVIDLAADGHSVIGPSKFRAVNGERYGRGNRLKSSS